jgi:hypothetical protein
MIQIDQAVLKFIKIDHLPEEQVNQEELTIIDD